jgi:rubrerythrin
MAHLYEVLAELHRGSSSTRSLWRKTAGEEHQHAAQFRLGMTNGGAMVSEVKIAWRDAREMIEAVETLARRYESEPPAIPEALKAAISLEESMTHLHMNRACRFANTSYQQLFNAMMAADRKHIESLREALGAGAWAPTGAAPELAVRGIAQKSTFNSTSGSEPQNR